MTEFLVTWRSLSRSASGGHRAFSSTRRISLEHTAIRIWPQPEGHAEKQDGNEQHRDGPIGRYDELERPLQEMAEAEEEVGHGISHVVERQR